MAENMVVELLSTSGLILSRTVQCAIASAGLTEVLRAKVRGGGCDPAKLTTVALSVEETKAEQLVHVLKSIVRTMAARDASCLCRVGNQTLDVARRSQLVVSQMENARKPEVLGISLADVLQFPQISSASHIGSHRVRVCT